MSVAWHKVWRDLAHNKLRTLLVVFSTAVGVFALGLVFGLSGMMRTRMTEDHRATIPAHITFWGGPFDWAVVEAIRREPGVADVEGEIRTSVHWKLEGETAWRDGSVVGRADYDAQHMNLVDLLEGHWPHDRELTVERQSSRYFDIPVGTTIVIESGQGEQQFPVEGIVRIPTVFPPQFGGNATFGATLETVAWLTGQEESFNQIYVRLESFDEERAIQVAKQIERQLERRDLFVDGYEITNPNVHWIQERVDTFFLILGVMGGMSLGLSAFLIINTMSAILIRQVWQIGVMKTVGATFGRVARIYLAVAAVYGTLAILVAVPLGALSAYLLADWMLDMLNIAIGTFRIIPLSVAIQIAVGLALPLLAAFAPVVGSARITPHQAISNYGLGIGFGQSWPDRLLGHIRFLPPSMSLSLRNTFRRKSRIVLTLFTLTFGGLMFTGVMNLRQSLNYTFEMLLRDFGHDVIVQVDRPYQTTPLINIAENVSTVTQTEVWNLQGARLSLPKGEERQIRLWGLGPNSLVFNPNLVGGRWLQPDDRYAIVLNSKIADEQGITVGDTIELTINGQKENWTVVGLIFNINNNQSDCFVPFETLAGEIGTPNRGKLVMVQSRQHDLASQQALINDLRNAYAAAGIGIDATESASEMRERNRAQYNIIIYLLLAMAMLAVVVGSLGLMGTISINVAERGREIGVMRAIGASSGTVIRIFVGEGITVGLVSWTFATLSGYLVSPLLSDAIGQKLFGIPLEQGYSIMGLVWWLLLVVVLSALASIWPAWRATRLSVRESLAYE